MTPAFQDEHPAFILFVLTGGLFVLVTGPDAAQGAWQAIYLLAVWMFWVWLRVAAREQAKQQEALL